MLILNAAWLGIQLSQKVSFEYSHNNWSMYCPVTLIVQFKMQCFIFIFLYDFVHAKFLSNYRINYSSNYVKVAILPLHTKQHYKFQYFIVQMMFIKKYDLQYRILSVKILHSRHGPNIFSHNYFVFTSLRSIFMPITTSLNPGQNRFSY